MPPITSGNQATGSVSMQGSAPKQGSTLEEVSITGAIDSIQTPTSQEQRCVIKRDRRKQKHRRSGQCVQEQERQNAQHHERLEKKKMQEIRGTHAEINRRHLAAMVIQRSWRLCIYASWAQHGRYIDAIVALQRGIHAVHILQLKWRARREAARRSHFVVVNKSQLQESSAPSHGNSQELGARAKPSDRSARRKKKARAKATQVAKVHEKTTRTTSAHHIKAEIENSAARKAISSRNAQTTIGAPPDPEVDPTQTPRARHQTRTTSTAKWTEPGNDRKSTDRAKTARRAKTAENQAAERTKIDKKTKITARGTDLIERIARPHVLEITEENQTTTSHITDVWATRRPFLCLPPSRKHVDTRLPYNAPTNPQQQAYLRGHFPYGEYMTRELTLPERMRLLGSCKLESGVAPMFGGGVDRLAEEFAEACGFTAALGSLVLMRAMTKVFCGGSNHYMLWQESVDVAWAALRTYWDEHVTHLDLDERFFRLIDNRGRGYIERIDLQPFIITIAYRHPDLVELCSDELLVYVDTVLATIFYYTSTCGILRLGDMRKFGLAAIILNFDKWELSKEITGYTHYDPHPRLPYAQREKVRKIWSLAQHWEIRYHFLWLCSDGWNIKPDTLRHYAQDGKRPVGELRAKRVIDAAFRPFLPGQSNAGLASAAGGYGEHLDYDSFVCFFLCERALTSSTCTERDIRYCFTVLDERGQGRLDIGDLERFFNDTPRTYPESSKDVTWIFRNMVSRHLAALGVDSMRGSLYLQDMIKPRYVELAGHFFEEVFSGMTFDNLLLTEVYPPKALEFERELKLICEHAWN